MTLAAQIRAMVREEVRLALVPHVGALERLLQVFAAPPRRADAKRAVARRSAGRTSQPTARRTSSAASSAPSPGASVIDLHPAFCSACERQRPSAELTAEVFGRRRCRDRAGCIAVAQARQAIVLRALGRPPRIDAAREVAG